MKYIDIDKWNRKEHFEFFRRMDYPQYNITSDIDITDFLNFTKSRKIPFYFAMIYVSVKAAESIENFRYRIKEGNVIEHAELAPSFTYMGSDKDDLFKVVTIDMEQDIYTFSEKASKKADAQKKYFPIEDMAGRDNLVYITCIPWVTFSHMSHTININKDDSVPRLSWGKYFKAENKIKLPYSVQVNHAFVDGIHIGQYFEKMQEIMSDIIKN